MSLACFNATMSGVRGEVHIGLLGPLQVRIGGQDRPITGPVRRALLAVLAQRPGEVLGEDLLCDLVWDGDPPPTAHGALRVHVSQLRKMLGRGELLQRVGTGYRLTIDPAHVDVTEFGQHIKAGRQALREGDLERAGRHLQAAKDLWRGTPLADVRSGAATDVERLLTQRSELNVDLAECRLRSQGVNADTGDLAALTVERPFDERVWRLLITAHYWTGRQADALATYHRAVAALDEELGVEPTAELRRLQEQILRQDPVLDPPAAANVALPVFATSFVGRRAEVGELVDLLGQHRLVTLTGLGGVGKTRLSVAAAEAAAGRFQHGVTFVALEPVEDPALVPAVIAAASGTTADRVEDLTAAVGERRLLLVLDNCEHLSAAVADVASAFLRNCPGVSILATSRVPLNVVGEKVWVTPALDMSAPEGAVPEAIHLFLERAGHAGPRAALPPVDDPKLLEVATLLGGIPLAIELAAAQCGVLTVADVLDQMNRHMAAGATERDRPARHHSMEAALTGTLEHLAPRARELLARMTVFRGPVGLEAVEAVCVDDGVPAEDVPALLAELAHAAVIAADVSGARGTYRILPPVRRSVPHVLVRLGHAPPDLADRHLTYLRRKAEDAAAGVGGPGEQEALAALDGMLADVRAALRYAIDDDPHRGLEMATALAPLWLRRRMNGEGRRWLRDLLEVSDGVDPAIQAAALHAAGGLAWDDGDQAAARTLLNRAWRIRHALDDPAGQALTLNNLAGLASDEGDHAGAYETWGRAHALFRAAEHRPGAAATQLNSGIAAHKLGRHDDAVRHLELARADYRGLGNEQMEAIALERLAAIKEERGERREAMVLTRLAEAAYTDHGTPEQKARLRWQRALRHRALGEHDRARDLVQEVARAVVADELLDAWWVPGLIETEAALTAAEHPEQTAQLLGVAARHRDRSGHGVDAATVPDLPEVRAYLEETLGAEHLAEEMTVGATRSAAAVVARIAGVRPETAVLSARTSTRPDHRPW